MDPVFVTFSGLLLVSISGNLVQIGLALMKRPTGVVGTIKGEIALHERNCKNFETILEVLKNIQADVKEHRDWHFKQATQRRRATDT